MSLLEWQFLRKKMDELIVQASTVEVGDGWQTWPIGMSFHFLSNRYIDFCLQKTHLVLCSLNLRTDQVRRPCGHNRQSIESNLIANGIPNKIIPSQDYFSKIGSYKFVVSPEGNGIDCHRHQEALWAGCIPIIERNPLTEEKYKDLPVLWTNDYSEVTPSQLEKQYETMLHQFQDFSKLLLSSYTIDEQKEIRRCGNYWTRKLTNTEWY